MSLLSERSSMQNIDADVLTAERSALMRAGVLAEVGLSRPTSAKRRPRRTLVAAAALVLIGGAGAVLAQQLRNGNDVASSISVVGEPSGSSESSGSSAGSDGTVGSSPVTNDSVGSVTVITGSESVEVTSAPKAADELADWVDSVEGRVDARATDGGPDGTTVSMTVRVPPAKVSALSAELRSIGAVTSESANRENVSGQAADLDARIRALRVSVARLEQLVKQASNTSELLAAERELTKRQAQLDSLQAQKRTLDAQVALASMQVTFTERPSASAVDPSGFSGGLVTGWNALTSSLDWLVTAVGVIVPWLALSAVLIVPLWLLLRRRRSSS